MFLNAAFHLLILSSVMNISVIMIGTKNVLQKNTSMTQKKKDRQREKAKFLVEFIHVIWEYLYDVNV